MARLRFKNAFGSAGQSGANVLDLQRADLFKVTLELPEAVGLPWDEHVEFAVATFPFPENAIDLLGVKYMQQTNQQIGGDKATAPIDIKVRYAFAQHTAQALSRWQYLVRNPQTGGVGLTSQCKAKGFLRWQVPNMRKQIADLRGEARPAEDTMKDGLVMVLEGCLISGLKFSDANMEESTHVTLSFGLSIDRVYPENLNAMAVLNL